MKRVLWSVLAGSALVALCTAVPASAATVLKANVGFAFTAGDKSFPAGSYEFAVDSETVVLKITSKADGKSVAVPTLTRLSARSDIKQPILVFDRAGEKSYLTELYVEGEDGYYLKGAPGKHQHVQVEAQK